MEQPIERPQLSTSEDDRLRYFIRKVQRHPVYHSLRVATRIVRTAVPAAWRLATNRQRKLPAAVIVGAQKAGTTQLYSWMLEHPRCFGGVRKEIQYFSKFGHRPVFWYRSQFPLATVVEAARGVCLEASPQYMSTAAAIHCMRQVLPDAKVIALLRDPVSRAFSQFQHYKQRHRESRDFISAVRESIADHVGRWEVDTRLATGSEPLLDYVARGYYAMQIEFLWQTYPPEQVLVIDSADLFDDTNAVCQRVFDFLGLERHGVQPTKIYNRGFYRETIDPAAAAMLREHFRPHDERLARLLGWQPRWLIKRAAA